MDINRSVIQQVLSIRKSQLVPPDTQSSIIYLRLKYYGITDEMLDNSAFFEFVFSQLRDDFTQGNLTMDIAQLVSLAAYILHIRSLTRISHVLPVVTIEQKLMSILPTLIASVQTIVPFVKTAMKVISSLTLEQAKFRFIQQCRTLPLFGVDKFSAYWLSNNKSFIFRCSCSGIVAERPYISGYKVTPWHKVFSITLRFDIIQISVQQGQSFRELGVKFLHPLEAKEAYDACITQKHLSEHFKWRIPANSFKPLVSIPPKLMTLQGESKTLSKAIRHVFSSAEDIRAGYFRGRKPGCTFFSEKDLRINHSTNTIAERNDFDSKYLDTTEESTLPLLYGSVLAQSTPLLRSPLSGTSDTHRSFGMVHKTRLAASRPLVTMDTVDNFNCKFELSKKYSSFDEGTFLHLHQNEQVDLEQQNFETSGDCTKCLSNANIVHTMRELNHQDNLAKQSVSLTLAQKMSCSGELEKEYDNLPSCTSESQIVNINLPIIFTIEDYFDPGNLVHEEFWMNSPPMLILLDSSTNIFSEAILRCDGTSSDIISIGSNKYLSFHDSTTVENCRIIRVAVNYLNLLVKSVWIFMYTKCFDITEPMSFLLFVEEVVASDLSFIPTNEKYPFSCLVIEEKTRPTSLSSLYIACHVLVRNVRVGKLIEQSAVYEIASAIRRFQPLAISSFSEYLFLHKLLLLCLRKPSRLI